MCVVVGEMIDDATVDNDKSSGIIPRHTGIIAIRERIELNALNGYQTALYAAAAKYRCLSSSKRANTTR